MLAGAKVTGAAMKAATELIRAAHAHTHDRAAT
jgi:hypothetical protein